MTTDAEAKARALAERADLANWWFVSNHAAIADESDPPLTLAKLIGMLRASGDALADLLALLVCEHGERLHEQVYDPGDGTTQHARWTHSDGVTCRPSAVAKARALAEPLRLDRETLARALCDESYWGGFSERTRDQWRIHADAILARLADAGKEDR
jgi:hypothetical protein